MAIITGTDLKSWIPHLDDTVDDSNLDLGALAASRAVVEWCGGPFRVFDKTATADASARVFSPAGASRERPYGSVFVTDFWSLTNLAVKTDDNDDGTYETTWTITTDFTLAPWNALTDGEPYWEIIPTGQRSLPTVTTRPTVEVTAAWGWTAVPSDVKLAALIKGSKLFGRRKSPEGVLGGFADFGAVRISRFEDPDVTDLLEPFRRLDRKFGIA